MYVSDALSQLYTEENHKITDIIPLNFLQHTVDKCTNETYKYYAESLYRHNIAVNKPAVNSRKRGRSLKGQFVPKIKLTHKLPNNQLVPTNNLIKMSTTVWL